MPGFSSLLRTAFVRSSPSSRIGTLAASVLFLAAASLVAPSSRAAAVAAPLRLTFTELAASPLIPPPAAERPAEREAWLQQLSAPIRAAEGNVVELTGYVLPLKIDGGRTRQFLLMRDQSSCCYGKTPALGEFVVVSTAASSPGIPATMDIPTKIRATLRIEPVSFGGELSQFYTLQNASAVAP